MFINFKKTSDKPEIKENPFIRTMRGDLIKSSDISFSEKQQAEKKNIEVEKKEPLKNIPDQNNLDQKIEKENIPTTTPLTKTIDLDSSNPFFDKPEPVSPEINNNEPKKEPLIEKPAQESSNTSNATIPNEAKEYKTSFFESISWSSLFISIGSAGFIIALFMGGYYFFLSTKQEKIEISTVNEPVPIEKPIDINPATEKYSSENANYLSIDINNSTQQSIRETLHDISEDVKKINSAAPIEFIVTDLNNNPISFHIFSTITNINFSENLLSSLSDDFSLFFVIDNDKVRLGLAIKSKNKELTSFETKLSEKDLAISLQPLILEPVPLSINGQFNDGNYVNLPVRYFNINPETNLSIDYMIINDSLIIGTSKKSMRSITDKVVSTKPVTITSSEATASTTN